MGKNTPKSFRMGLPFKLVTMEMNLVRVKLLGSLVSPQHHICALLHREIAKL